MRKFLVLLKKELKELITIQIILPFLIVVIMFSLLGNYMQSKNEEEAKKPVEIAIIDQDNSQTSKNIESILSKSNFNVIYLPSSENIKQEMSDQDINVSLIIPANFEKNILNKNIVSVDTYILMNDLSVFSSSKYTAASSAISLINQSISTNNIINVIGGSDISAYTNPISQNPYIIVGDKYANIGLEQIMSFITRQTMIIPIILFLVIILASQMVATAIATEKENKTLETLLSSPVDRKLIVASKMLAAGLVALIMAAVYMYGYKNYMDGIMGNSDNLSSSISQAAQSLGFVFTTKSYILLGTSLFFSILVGLSIAIILGVFAQDAKSAQSVIAPLMILIMIPYFLTMFLDINSLSQVGRYLIYAIPFSHAFLAAPSLLMGNDTFVIYGIIYQAIIFLVFVYIAAKIFSTDYIMTMQLNFAKKKN